MNTQIQKIQYVRHLLEKSAQQKQAVYNPAASLQLGAAGAGAGALVGGASALMGGEKKELYKEVIKRALIGAGIGGAAGAGAGFAFNEGSTPISELQDAYYRYVQAPGMKGEAEKNLRLGGDQTNTLDQSDDQILENFRKGMMPPQEQPYRV